MLREQPGEYLVYNAHTDELHLLTPTARYLYLLCDGLNTVADLREQLDPDGDGRAVTEFLADLIQRGLVTPAETEIREAGAP